MSISIVLIPAAIAAATWAASHGEKRDSEGRTVIGVSTRMRDVGLLTEALADTRAVVTQRSDDSLIARWQNVSAHFHRDPARADAAWEVDFIGQGRAERRELSQVTEESVQGIVAAVDAAYGRRVQQAVLTRLRERAPQAGMTLPSGRVLEPGDEGPVVGEVVDDAARGERCRERRARLPRSEDRPHLSPVRAALALFGKPVSTFPDHALSSPNVRAP